MKNFCCVQLTSINGEALTDCISTNLSQKLLDLKFFRGKDTMEPATRAVQRCAYKITHAASFSSVVLKWGYAKVLQGIHEIFSY